ncbi:MAG: cytochrome c maturation protein CcmE [Bacteroidia bacterium]|nr:cytochrome c maturation protein CcmE [Bacteroidia bacterium]
MNKFFLFAILLVVVCVGVLLSTLNKTATYAHFEEAAKHPDKEFHVVGKWDKTKPWTYDPAVNPNRMEFVMADAAGKTFNVVLHKPMPPDFEKSEQIVLVGKVEGGVFHANDVLLKCPSKYNETQNKAPAP